MTGFIKPFDLGTRKIVDSNGPDLVSLIIWASNIRWTVRSRHGLVRVSLRILDVLGFDEDAHAVFPLRKNVSQWENRIKNY